MLNSLFSSANPLVTIGLTLSTSAPTLSVSATEPFYVVVTARILSTPHPDRPVTLLTHVSPLDDLDTRGFHNIICTNKPEKKIEIYPNYWSRYVWDPEDLRDTSSFKFVTIPPSGHGSYSVRHEVPLDKIKAANLEGGETYRVALTDLCLGTRWWTFASTGELEGVRLRGWSCRAEYEDEDDDPELRKELEREYQEKYGTGPVTNGEEPRMLAMVAEGEPAEFEIV